MLNTDTPGKGLSPEQMTTAIAALSSPDTVESPFGQPEFFDGVPRPATVSAVYAPDDGRLARREGQETASQPGVRALAPSSAPAP